MYGLELGIVYVLMLLFSGVWDNKESKHLDKTGDFRLMNLLFWCDCQKKDQPQNPWVMKPERMDGWYSTDSSCITGPISHDIT